MLAGMNGDVRCDRRGEPRAGRGDPVRRGHAQPRRCQGVLRPFGTGRTRTVTLTAAA